MNTPDKCPHCGAIRIEGREYACGFIFRKGVKNNPRPHECLLNSEVSAHAATREREKSTIIAFGVMKLTAEGWESECKKATSELAATKRELEMWKNNAGTAITVAIERIQTQRDAAESRVRELEGLRITGTHYFSDFVGVAVTLPIGSTPTIGRTLGEAMGGGK